MVEPSGQLQAKNVMVWVGTVLVFVTQKKGIKKKFWISNLYNVPRIDSQIQKVRNILVDARGLGWEGGGKGEWGLNV